MTISVMFWRRPTAWGRKSVQGWEEEGTVRRGEALGREAFQALTAVRARPRWRSLPCTPAVCFSVEARVTRGRMATLCLAPGDWRSQRSPQCLAELGLWFHVLFLSVLPRGPPRPALTCLTSP